MDTAVLQARAVNAIYVKDGFWHAVDPIPGLPISCIGVERADTGGAAGFVIVIDAFYQRVC